MAYNNTSSSVAAGLQSSRPSSPASVSPPSSPGPSSQQTQHRILNRMSTLFGGKKKNHANASSGSSSAFNQASVSTSANDRDSETLVASQVDSMFNDERTASCVDSMYSSLQSRRSAYRPVPNPNTPAPLRTVQLDNPIVHLPTPTPPTPPPNNLSEQSTNSVSASSVPQSPSPPLSSTSNESTIKSPNKSTSMNASSRKVEDIEAQFKLLLVIYIDIYINMYLP